MQTDTIVTTYQTMHVCWQKPLNITNIFQDLKDVTLHVPKGTREAYMKSENWKELNVVED
ncbi:MAG: hypothetical protein MJZ41_11420 [Bacteroidaceae bacterium]|nr:hypothetical protein [Bacteroidaceae bacterium]